jgi:hypothetical protein
LRLADATTLARALDPKYPTNRAVIVLMGLGFVAVAILGLARGAAVGPAALHGLVWALALFLAWAIGRELAPDDQVAAFVAIVVVLGAWAYGAAPELLPALAVVGLVRIVNRTVGPPATWIDLLLYLAVGGWLVWRGDWEVGVAGGLALLLDFRLPTRHLAALPFAAGFVAITVATWRRERPVFGPPQTNVEWIAAVVAIAFALVLVTQPPLEAEHDRGGGRCDRRRVQGGMTVGLVAALATLGRGEAHVLSAAPLWAALVGVVVSRPLHIAQRWRRRRRSPDASA